MAKIVFFKCDICTKQCEGMFLVASCRSDSDYGSPNVRSITVRQWRTNEDGDSWKHICQSCIGGFIVGELTSGAKGKPADG